MATPFDKIIFLTRSVDQAGGVKKQQIEPIVHTVVGWAKQHNIPTSNTFPKETDQKLLIISIGGDGTMLQALRRSLDYENCSVIGFNAGTLGFLTDDYTIEDFITFLDNVYRQTDQVIVDERAVLEGKILAITHDNKVKRLPKTRYAINEFVIGPLCFQNPGAFNVFINNKFVTHSRGCGMIVSTATGSTAMALSAGGAIMNPSTKMLQIVPLTSHTLASRPIVTTGRDVVRIEGEINTRISSLVGMADGQQIFHFGTSDDYKEIQLTITRSEKTVRIWRPQDWNFFEVLTSKLA